MYEAFQEHVYEQWASFVYMGLPILVVIVIVGLVAKMFERRN